MNVLNNVKTSVKLISGFMLIVFITAVIGGIGIYYLRLIDVADTHLYEHNIVPIGQLTDISVAVQQMRVSLRDLLLTTDPEETKHYTDAIKQLSKEIEQYSAEYEKLIISTEMGNLYNEYARQYRQFTVYRDQIIALDQEGKGVEALNMMRKDAYTTSVALEANIEAMQTLKIEQAREASISNTAQANQGSTIMFVLIIFGTLLGIGLGIVISNSITNPLAIMSGALQNLQLGNLNRDIAQSVKDAIMMRDDEFGSAGKALTNTEIYLKEMAEIAQNIAMGNLTVHINPHSDKDELGNALAKMIEGLRGAVGQVAESANAVSSAAAQLSTASKQSGEATSQIADGTQAIQAGLATPFNRPAPSQTKLTARICAKLSRPNTMAGGNLPHSKGPDITTA